MARTVIKIPTDSDLTGKPVRVLDDGGDCRHCPKPATVFFVTTGDGEGEPIVVHSSEACEGFKSQFGTKKPEDLTPSKALDERGWQGLGWKKPEPVKQQKLPDFEP